MNVDDAVSRSYGDYEDLLGEIKTVQHEYEQYKLRNNCVDYDDLLVYLRAVLGIDEARERLSARYRYIMVDEFQDTNGVQADIVRLLSKKHRNVMVVGDDAQSIYGFRGANHLNILQFPEEFKDCAVITLEENYRSTQSILDVGNSVLKTMVRKFEKRLVSATGNIGDKPLLRRFDDVYEEAAWVAQKVQSLRATGLVMRGMAVLFRTAFTSMPLQAELVKRGIRFKLFGGRKFYEMANVRDVVSYLRLVANPTDELAWHRVLLLLPGIGARTVERLLGLIAHYTSLTEILEKVFGPLCTDQKNAGVFASLKMLLQTISGPSMLPGRQLELVREHYDPLMKVKYKKEPSKVKELVMLGQMAQRYRTLKDFLADVAVDPDKDGKDDDYEFLTLSTVHSAKGLEWERVFLIGLADGIFPSHKALVNADREEIEEEKRLFYVAVTRAKEELFLSFSTKKGSNERIGANLCRFLEPDEVKKTFETQTGDRPVRTIRRRPGYR